MAGMSRKFLYVEVPLSKRGRSAVRSRARDTCATDTAKLHAANTGGHVHAEHSRASEGTGSIASSGPSLKDKERGIGIDPPRGLELEPGSPPSTTAQTTSVPSPSSSLPAASVATSQSAGPSTISTPSAASEGLTLPAPAIHPTHSLTSSTFLQPDSPAIARPSGRQKNKTTTRKRKKRVIVESDTSNPEKPSSAQHSPVHQAGPVQTTIAPISLSGPANSASPLGSSSKNVTGIREPEYTSLGIDEEISKILGRTLFGQDYAYTVKLKGGQRALVPESALHEYQDLLDDWQDLCKDGWREDGKVYSDSEPEGGTPASTRKQATIDEAYSDDMREESPEPDEIVSDEDVPGTGSDLTSMRAGTGRRSVRGAAKRRIDYSMQVEDDEADENSSDGALTDTTSEPSDTDNMSVSYKAGTRAGRKKKAKPGRASSSSVQILDDDDSEESEEFIEGGVKEEELRPEQIHQQTCSHCKASSAKTLLPEYIKKAKRKRKSVDAEGEWDAASIKGYGSWIWCDVCSSSWHWKCLPGQTAAHGMRMGFKKRVNAKFGPGSHLSINKTFRIPSCPDCLKPEGTKCKFCLQSEPFHDITKDPELEEPAFGPPAGQEAPSSAVTSKISSQTQTEDGEPLQSTTEASAQAQKHSLPGNVINDARPVDADLLFRCTQCKRAAHYTCIPTKDATDVWQYSWDWHCDDCKTWGAIDAVLAWRPLDWDKTQETGPSTPRADSVKRIEPGSPGKQPIAPSDIPDPKAPWWNAEYLVKFKETSFRHATWVPHSWLYSAYRQRLRNFLVNGPLIDITPDNATRDGEENVLDDHLENFSLFPMPDAFDKIPREWLTPDRFLDVRLKSKSGSGGDPRVLNMKKRITDDPADSFSRISEMYVKWQGLPYDTATWEQGFPKQDDPQYSDFVRAYRDYLKFRDVEIPRPSQKELAILDRARPPGQFKEVTVQPDFITLGKLMDFQLLGVSWLYFNWWIKKGCILADEMGLGKTVQIISFLSILFRSENCKPFLVVVPNSTLGNWQREFARWAPDDMRIVPYYGTRASRRIIEEFELFSEGAVTVQKLRTHVELTTYECLTNDTALFKRVPRWEALVVDEAQRLKSGPKNLLWRALEQLRFGHTVLLTGTPVNNNLDELFNLLYFLDPPNFRNLDELHTRFETLTPELVEEVQALAQPYFLRRTKEAVLNLPPLSEVIVPLSMSPLQKVVYKSVLEKNMDALKAIYDDSKARSKKNTAGKVTNVLMELRKTLCHPYLVREELEHDAGLDGQAIHKNLVEASSKLAFLADFLPKLKERGHRVLLFSQFVIVLNVIERFLEGMRMRFVRLDGNTSQAERQKHIDAYNAPDSEIFIFILTTRAGGVGINLASADTVILFDADFNPFQDLQAISRAHRIGQTRKVMCFKLMVKGTCEEKIIESGKKKMVLEQLIVDSKDSKDSNEDEGVTNVESLLLFGAQALFTEDPDAAATTDIHYSSRDIDELIAKTENEEISAEEQEAKKQRTIEANKAFSYARVWDRQVREQGEEADKRELEAQRGFWSKMIEAKEKEKKDEELARALQMGRGHRRRQQANYNSFGGILTSSPVTSKSGNLEASDSEDEDHDSYLLSEDSDAESSIPAALDPEAISGLDSPAKKKAKPAQPPISHAEPPALLYADPLPINIAPNQPPHVRYEIARSPTPPDITEKRTVLIKNLLRRAESIRNKAAIDLLRQAANAKRGQEQVDLCRRAAVFLST